jgi:hypothetical protein
VLKLFGHLKTRTIRVFMSKVLSRIFRVSEKRMAKLSHNRKIIFYTVHQVSERSPYRSGQVLSLPDIKTVGT